MVKGKFAQSSKSIIPLVSIAFTFVTDFPYTVFLTTSLFTTLFSLLKSTATVFNLCTSILSTLAFKLAKSNFAARLDVSSPVDLLNQRMLHNYINPV